MVTRTKTKMRSVQTLNKNKIQCVTYSNRVAAYSNPSTSDGVCSSTGLVNFETDFLAALDLSHVYVSTSHSNNNVSGHFTWCAFKVH